MVLGGDATVNAESLLKGCVGRTVMAARRIRYVYRGSIRNEHGTLELTFEDGSSICLDAGGDGETLAVTQGPWIDPFAEPLSEVNREFVDRSGKWSAFELSASEMLGQIIGQSVVEVDPRRGFMDKLVGIRFGLVSADLVAIAEADELHVTLTVSC